MSTAKDKRPLAEISAFVPAYNEADNIAEVVDRLHSAMESVARKHEVIVVLFEGTTDGTDRVLAGLEKEDELLRVVVQPASHRGYGVALRLGIEAARYRYIFYTDADNQFDPAEIVKLAPLMQGADLVSGIRADRQDPLARKITAKVYNKIMDVALGTKLQDVDCAFKLFRKSMFEGMNLTSNTGLIDPEIVARARADGRLIMEVPVTHFARTAGEAHFEADARFGIPEPQVVFGILSELWELRKAIKADYGDDGHVL
jgi:glycosyltransferase involved in cell wall biosynthesis